MASTSTIPVHTSNAEALAAWDGNDGEYWVDNEQIFDRALERHDRPFLDAAAIRPGEQVLDIGCGNGQIARDAARLAAPGSVLGVDLSSRMVERARRRAQEQGIDNVTFVQADAQVHAFGQGEFDVAISRTGAMFFGDPGAAFTNIAGALTSGGRLALLVWRSLAENHWIRDFFAALAAGRDLPGPPPDAPGPFSMADPERVRPVLTASGFADVAFEAVDELMWFGHSADEAFRFVAGMGFTSFMLRDLAEESRERALADLRASLDAHATPEGVLYPSAAWIVTARRSDF